jgi:hypothetical protein
MWQCTMSLRRGEGGTMPTRGTPVVHRLLWCALLVLLSVAIAQGAPWPTRWRSPDGWPRPRHAAPPVGRPLVGQTIPSPAATKVRPAPGDAGWRGRLCLVVADGLYTGLESDLNTFRQDLEAYGYATVTYRFVSGDAPSLRSYLQTLWKEPQSLVGAEFIGDLPYVVYEMMYDWGLGDGLEYEDFPCDLYFMDMDGTWSDALTDHDVAPDNGKYDAWSESPGSLEIWVSRIDAKPLTALGSETETIRHYLQKNHRFRTGALHPEWGSLIYPDDDWAADYGDPDQQEAELLYPAAKSVLVTDPEGTTATDYLRRFTGGFEYIHTRSHGYSGGHGYYERQYGVFHWVYPEDYTTALPPALFYSFFVCSGSDYTQPDNLAGTVVLDTGDSGLFAWGSTKTGGMWADCAFLTDVSQGFSFGAAFTDWYACVAACYPDIAPAWWHGMVLIGDGTLPSLLFADVPRSQWAAHEIEACARASVVRGLADGTYDPSGPVTRAAMAVYISRALAGGDANVPAGPVTAAFTDVPTTYWAYRYVEYAKAQSIVKGYDATTYSPETQVDRGQMAAFVARAMVSPPGDAGLAGYTPPTRPTFPDVTDSGSWAWCRLYVEYIAAQGVTRGYADGLYHPDVLCARDQMAVYVARAFHLAVP